MMSKVNRAVNRIMIQLFYFSPPIEVTATDGAYTSLQGETVPLLSQ